MSGIQIQEKGYGNFSLKGLLVLNAKISNWMINGKHGNFILHSYRFYDNNEFFRFGDIEPTMKRIVTLQEDKFFIYHFRFCPKRQAYNCSGEIRFAE